jgi:hypothetical protein
METRIIDFLKENKGIHDQYGIYNKLVEAKEDTDIKSEFLFKLNNIKKYDNNASVVKKDGIYYVQYNEDEIKDEDIKECQFEYQEQFIKPSKFYKYIINNNLENDYIDLETKNTIYHDIIIGNHYKIIKKLISQGKMNFLIENKEGRTALSYIEDNKLFSLILEQVLKNQIIHHNEKQNWKNIINLQFDNTLQLFILFFWFILALFFSNIIIWFMLI